MRKIEDILRLIGRILLTITLNAYAIYWGDVMYKYYLQYSYISKFFIIVTLFSAIFVIFGNYATWSDNLKIRHSFYKLLAVLFILILLHIGFL